MTWERSCATRIEPEGNNILWWDNRVSFPSRPLQHRDAKKIYSTLSLGTLVGIKADV